MVCAVSYASGMDKASFERVMLWWLKYREKGATPPHTGYTIVDGQELQKVLETKVPCSAPSALSFSFACPAGAMAEGLRVELLTCLGGGGWWWLVVIETQLGRPYTMEILETRLDDKLNALADNMDGNVGVVE